MLATINLGLAFLLMRAVLTLGPTIAIVLMTAALWRAVRFDWHEKQVRERNLRRSLREMLEHPDKHVE